MKNFLKFKNGFSQHKFGAGVTFIELLITIALIGVLAAGIITILNPKTQLDKANDAKRKSDLEQIQSALEMYYQDNKAYPASTADYKITRASGAVVQWGDDWTPYMGNLPKDPSSSKKYGYVKNVDGYYLFASLDRGGNDLQACYSSGNPCDNAPAGACGSGICTYGVSSPNLSP